MFKFWLFLFNIIIHLENIEQSVEKDWKNCQKIGKNNWDYVDHFLSDLVADDLGLLYFNDFMIVLSFH